MQRAVILSPRGRFELGDHLVAARPGPDASAAATKDPAPAKDPPRSLEEVEREHILSVLDRTSWRVSGDRGAARILGLKRTTLEARMKKLGIHRPA
jgi:transcriptional regulator with GAF, ATPase, and Fis domain